MNDETTADTAQTGSAGTGSEGTSGPAVPRAPGVFPSLAILVVAVAALIAAGALALNLRYVATAGGDGGPIVDTWTRTVTVVEGGFASTVPMEFNDSRTVPGGLLWGDYEDVPFRTELQYTSGRMHYEFATEDFATAVRLVDTTTDSQEPVGISFSGRMPVDQGTWDAIAGVRTQYR